MTKAYDPHHEWAREDQEIRLSPASSDSCLARHAGHPDPLGLRPLLLALTAPAAQSDLADQA